MAKVLILICLLLVATLSKTAPVLDEEGRSKVEKAKQVLFNNGNITSLLIACIRGAFMTTQTILDTSTALHS